jgi:long-chain acyl-CoA synthetase
MSEPLSMFQKWEKETPTKLLFHQPLPDGPKTYTYGQAGAEMRSVAAALVSLNLPPRSRVAILSKNCAHWMMADFAVWMAGHISVPLYPTLSAHAIKQILDHSESTVIFVGKLDEYSTQKEGISASIQKISFPFYGINDGLQWDDLVAKHAPLKDIATFDRNEMATIKYTSGTTGMPKGVMISFNAIDHALGFAFKQMKTTTEERFFSYLPLSHIAERMLVELGAIYNGASIYFSESLEKFPHDLASAQPTVFLAVPRIWAKFREKILEKLPQKRLNLLLSIPILSSLVKKKIKKGLGLTHSNWTLTGASPISVELLEWYDKLGIHILEVYGMTENLAYAYSNIDEVKFGSIGKAWRNIEGRLSSEGEIQTKSPATMLGYYKSPELTAEVFTPDGFLKSGDVGQFDDRGFLTITGRIKDQFKTDKGKYVAPLPIELKVSSNTDIEQVCVVGMGVPQPIMLVVLSAAGRSKSKEEIIQSLSTTIELVNKELEAYERLQAAVIMKDDWTIPNGLLTPSMKVKRNEVEKLHLPKYPHWYDLARKVVWENE